MAEQLFALTMSCIQGITREHWGAKIELPDGTIRDTGVQSFVDELVARLAAAARNPLGTLIIQKPIDAPAIQIISDGDTPHDGLTGDFPVVTGGSVSVNGCSVTLSLTTATWHFESGLLTSVT